VAELEESLEVKSGGTTADLEFTVEEVSCVGACALAPVVLINGRVHRQQTRSSLKRLLRDVPSATPDAKATKAKPRAKAKHINGGTDR
jgi:NADH:ubiquinone oxidoreductase subunit E